MSTIVTRAGKGSPLTNAEIDADFNNLNTDKWEVGGTYAAGAANGVPYLSATKVLTTDAAKLVFDGASLGVGTSSPVARLDVVNTGNISDIRMLGSGSTAAGFLYNVNNLAILVSNRDPKTGIFGNASNSSAVIALDSNSANSFITFGTTTVANTSAIERVRIEADGDVGIGTAAPQDRLHVSGGNVRLDNDTGLNWGDSSVGIYGNAGSEKMTFATASTDRAVIDVNGLFGIGLTAPTAKLDIADTWNNALTTFTAVKLNVTDTASASGSLVMDLQVGGASKVSVTKAGNVGIGTSSPSVKLSLGTGIGKKFLAYETATIFSGFGVDIAGSNSFDIFHHGAGGGFLTFGQMGTNGATYTERMRIDTNGNVGIGGTPSERLSVFGTSPILGIRDGGPGQSAALKFIDNAGTTKGGFTSESGFMTGFVGATEVIRLTTAGLGIGTNTLAAKLHAATTSAAAVEVLRLENTDATGKQSFIGFKNTGLGSPTTRIYGGGTTADGSGTFKVTVTDASGTEQSIIESFNSASVKHTALFTAGSERMRIDSSGNVGIGTVTPGAKLDVAGVIRSNAGIKSITASGGQPEFVLDQSGVASWSIYNPPSGTTLRFYNGVDRMILDSSGNVGIGASAPGAKLHLSGTFGAASTGGLRVDGLGATTGNLAPIAFYHQSTNWGTTHAANISSRLADGLDGGGQLLFSLASTGQGVPSEVMRLTSAGLGIGATDLSATGKNAKFAVAGGGINLDDDWYVAWGGGTGRPTVQGNKVGGNIQFGIGGTEQMRLTSAGLGIGTGNPIAKLDVNGNININGGSIGYNPSGDNFVYGGATYPSYGLATAPTLVGLSGYYGVALFTGNTERARVDSSGNLLVGTTANPGPGRIMVSTNTLGNAAGAFEAGVNSYAAIALSRTNDGTVARFYQAWTGGGVGSISITATATAYNTSSDYRLKDITGPVVNSGAFIDALRPVRGSWKVDGSPFVGFLAHQFQEVSPSSVTGTKDAVDEAGKPIYQSMQASSPEAMANIVAELQSLRARVFYLESQTIH